jgi:hypothetical protein
VLALGSTLRWDRLLSAFRCSAATSALQPRAPRRGLALLASDPPNTPVRHLREDRTRLTRWDSFTCTTEPEYGPRFCNLSALYDVFTKRPARRPETSVQHYRG